MDVHLAGSRPTRKAPPEYFTGTVLQDPIIQTEAPARLASTRVSFEPGARTAWHTHPLGQTLYVISGVARSSRAGTKRSVNAGPTSRGSPGRSGLVPRIQMFRRPFLSRTVVIVAVDT